MNMALAQQGTTASAVELALIGGDLAQLTPSDRLAYYTRLCTSLDLNPLTKPFEYITLNGKLTLYARKDCTEQLRSKRGVSVVIAAREITEDVYVVTARAVLANGRSDESIGAVSIAGLKGENRANAMMKAETKAKRRVTLSICGLGMLDETEIETIPSASYTVQAPAVVDKSELASVNDLPRSGAATAASRVDPSGGDSAPSAPFEGYRIITFSKPSHGAIKGIVSLLCGGTGQILKEDYAIYEERLAAFAEACCQELSIVQITFKKAASGKEYVVGIVPAASNPEGTPSLHEVPVLESDIPF